MARSLICVRRGHELIHINDRVLAERYFSAPLQAPQGDVPLTAAAIVFDAAAQVRDCIEKCTGAPVKNYRDVYRFARSRAAPSLLLRRLQQLFAAADHLRHCSAAASAELLEEVSSLCAAGTVERADGVFSEEGEAMGTEGAAPSDAESSGDGCSSASGAECVAASAPSSSAAQTDISLTNSMIIPVPAQVEGSGCDKASFAAAVVGAAAADEEFCEQLRQELGDAAAPIAKADCLAFEGRVAGLEARLATGLTEMDAQVRAAMASIDELQTAVGALRVLATESGADGHAALAGVKRLGEGVPGIVEKAVEPATARLWALEKLVVGMREEHAVSCEKLQVLGKEVDICSKLAGDAWKRASHANERLVAVAGAAA